jgi:hypothetical protein
MSDIGIPSRPAAMMLSEMANMNINEIELVNDLGLGIASVMEDVREMIENPPKKRYKQEGAEVIQLCSHLIPAVQELKTELHYGNLDLTSYLQRLSSITDELSLLTEKNHSSMVSPAVRNHMRNMANIVLLDAEAGAVVNTMFNIIGTELSSDDDSDPA